MKFSFSTNAFVRHTVSEAVRSIAAAGYEGVELLADAPHLYAPDVNCRDLVELKALLARTGLQPANINANTAVGYYGRPFWEPLFEPSLANPEPRERHWRIDYTKRCIDMARTLGSPCVSITSGRMVPGTLPERSLDLLKESLREVAEHAAAAGVKVGIEYEPGLLVENCEELASLLEELDPGVFGANLDLGHSHVLGEDPRWVARRLASKIFHVHLEDIRARKHYHLIPGTGDMKIGSLLRLLDVHGYRGFVTVELYTFPERPAEAARDSLKVLRKIERLEEEKKR
ncbi:MAG: sugar phosphate isomerase/epimerase family protein [Syntrophobacteraceae bacterium]|nr:sugar phosphate isomerase/epimerase [Desulfobacteraceae bacterium]